MLQGKHVIDIIHTGLLIALLSNCAAALPSGVSLLSHRSNGVLLYLSKAFYKKGQIQQHINVLR